MKSISTNPQFAEATTEIETLAAALGKVNGRIHEIEAQLRTQADFAKDSGDAHVNAALRFAETGKVESVGSNVADLQGEHVTLRTQRDKVQEALAARQQERDRLVGELSATVCRSLEDSHRKLAGRALEALKAIDALVQEEEEMIRAAESAGYRVSFREYVRWPYIGTLSMGSSEAAIWTRVRELQRYAR